MPERNHIITLSLPLSVSIPRKKGNNKVFIANLNGFRNAHHFTLNKAKHLYHDEVKKAYLYALNGPLLIVPPLACIFTVYPSTGRKFDISNVCSIIDKFSLDALVDLKVIPDDNYKIIRDVTYRFGEVDRNNPRCELKIFSIK